MTPEQALHNLAAAARAYRGTLDEHQALQQSVQVLAKALGLKANGTPAASGVELPAAEAKDPK